MCAGTGSVPAVSDLRLCSALRSGDEEGELLLLGDRVRGMPESTRRVVTACHEAVAALCGGVPDAPATAAASLRLFHNYRTYAADLRKEAFADSSMEDALAAERTVYRLEFAARMWCLVHAAVVDTSRLPGTAYLSFFRGVRASELLVSEQEVTLVVEKCLGQLPPVPASLLLEAAEEVHPLAQLQLALELCAGRPDDAALQSQVQVAAADWAAFVLSPEGGAHLKAFMVGLAKRAETSTLHRLLEVTKFLGTVGGLFRGAGVAAELAELVVHVSAACAEHARVMGAFVSGDVQAKLTFAEWRTQVLTTFEHLWSGSVGGAIKKCAEGEATQPFVEALLEAFDHMAVSQDLMRGEGKLDWKEVLAIAVGYMQPDASMAEIGEYITGEHGIFRRLEYTAEDVEALSAEDKVTLQCLKGELLDVLSALEHLEVPGLLCHLIAVLRHSDAAVNLVGHAVLGALHDRTCAAYAGDLAERSFGCWRIALDYATWGGGEEGKAAFANILQTLDVSGRGLDHIVSLYEAWHLRDQKDLAVKRSILSCLGSHGHRLLRRGLVVEGVRRLLQAEEYDAVEEHLVRMLQDWAAEILTNGAVADQEGWSSDKLLWMFSDPVMCLAEACNTQSIFKWPTAEEARRKDAVFFSKAPSSFLDVLSLTPLVARLASACIEQSTVPLREAALELLQLPAAPTLLRLAVLHLLTPLLNHPDACFFPGSTLGMLSACLEDCLHNSRIEASLHRVPEANIEALRLAHVTAGCKVACFTVPALQDSALH